MESTYDNLECKLLYLILFPFTILTFQRSEPRYILNLDDMTICLFSRLGFDIELPCLTDLPGSDYCYTECLLEAPPMAPFLCTLSLD